MKLLVIDDDPYWRRRAKDSLPGQELVFATDENAAKEIIRTQRFDVIISDMELTENGREGEALVNLARMADSPNKNAAIVGWSSDKTNDMRFSGAGADAFVYKGIRVQSTLPPAINEALALAHQRDSSYPQSLPSAPITPGGPA